MQRPTWNCGHPVSPNPTTEEARLHVGHATAEYLDEQYAANAECALLGADSAVWWCREYSRRRWLITQLADHG